MCARGASAGVRKARASEVESDRDLPSCHVGNQGRDQIGAHATGALVFESERAVLELLETTHAHADEHARAVPLLVGEAEIRLLQGHARGGHREGNEARALLHLLLFHPRRGLEVLHLAGDARGKALVGRENGDGSSAALATTKRVPRRFGAHPDRGDHTDARNDDALHQTVHSPSRGGRLRRAC